MDQEIIKQVEEMVNPVYLVGGSVRDLLLGLEPKDYDFASPLMPDEIEQKVRDGGKKAFVTGKRFGTIGFTIEGKLVEITTFRQETYGKTRKPQVEFVKSIEEDLSRRDFTINAIAIRGKRVIDPYDGQKDLQAKLIRCVGKPAERFNEDPLRMLRAARFAAQLDFSVEDETLGAMQKHGHKLLQVSRERWMQELDKLLLTDRPVAGLNVLSQAGLIKFMLPELRLQIGYDQHSPWHDYTLWEHSLATLQQLPKDINLRWAGLLHDIGKPFVRLDKPDRSNYVHHDLVGAELIYGIAKRLRWSNARLEAVAELVRGHMKDESPIRAADNSSKKLTL